MRIQTAAACCLLSFEQVEPVTRERQSEVRNQQVRSCIERDTIPTVYRLLTTVY